MHGALIAMVAGALLAAGGCTVDDGMPKLDATVYFLVAEPSGKVVFNDSYVLPLTRADHIAHARDLIRRGPDAAGAPIVVATMCAGADGINRDLRAKGAPEWSWHVTNMVGFADSTMEILDGWPSLVEEDVAWWIDNTCFDDETGTEGVVGFWGYTVVRELRGYPGSLP